MYAVYVLAAILLSVAPMHASTVLAALPSVSSTQRSHAGRSAANERRAASATRCDPANLGQASAAQAGVSHVHAEHDLPSARADSDSLAHAPNAP